MGSLRLYMLLLLVAVAPRAYAQSPCADGARPVCSDGSEAAAPPDGCADGVPPTCADGTVLSAPDGADAAPSGGSGSATATGCSPTTCTADGNSNYVLRSYTYGADGKITGTIKTNNCITHALEGAGSSGTYSCEEQTFPDPSYASTPAAMSLLGRAGMSLAGGNHIYSMFEAGFGSGTQPKPCGGTAGQAMSGTYGECDGGLSVEICEQHLAAECPGDERTELFLDECGGHASPYHFHADLVCEYDLTTGTHSRATGAALDGRIIYGKYETGTTAPADLDLCNGHVGDVPEDAEYGFTAGSVYHYHMTDHFPHTIGCFGPVADEAACRALYPNECNGVTVATTVLVDGESLVYDVELYCPCTDPAAAAGVTPSTPNPTAGTGVTPTPAAATPTAGATPAPTAGTVVTPTPAAATPTAGAGPTPTAGTGVTPTPAAATPTAGAGPTPTAGTVVTPTPAAATPTAGPTPTAGTGVTPTTAGASPTPTAAAESTGATPAPTGGELTGLTAGLTNAAGGSPGTRVLLALMAAAMVHLLC